MAKDKVTDRDARLYWEACAAAALSGAAGDVIAWRRDHNAEDMEPDIADAAYALAELALAEWAEKWGYEGALDIVGHDDEEGD